MNRTSRPEHRRWMLIVPLLAAVIPVSAGSWLWMPDIEVCQNTQIQIPVYIEGAEASDSLVAYDCSFEYNPDCLSFLGIDAEGCMTAAWGMPYVNSEPGHCSAAGFSSNQTGHQLIDTTEIWFYLNFNVICDTSQTTDVGFTRFRLFSLAGEYPVDSLGNGHVRIVVNYPPVISPFPGINLLEDDSTQIPLADFITDPNNTWTDLALSFDSNPYLSLYLDSSGVLTLYPEADWSGKTAVSFEVTDPFDASVQGKLSVRVLPVSDPPGTFRLISPGNDTTLVYSPQGIPFHWEASQNLDPGDEITYRFFFSPDSLFQSPQTLFIPDLTSPELRLNYSLEPGLYYWSVMAHDSDGLLRWCEKNFRLDIVKRSGVEIAKDMPGKFEMEQNFPNPFNQETCLIYHLDRELETRITIVNAAGEKIAVLANGKIKPGRHRVAWNGCDGSGKPVPSGIYWAVMRAEDRMKTVKLCFVK